MQLCRGPVVTAKKQYMVIYHEDDNWQAYRPDRSAPGWKKALDLARLIINEQTAQIPNPIGNSEYFRSSKHFREKAILLKKGEYSLDGNIVVDVKEYGKNTYFNYK